MGKYIKTSERVQRANHGAAYKASSWTSYLPGTSEYLANYDKIDWTDKPKPKPKRKKKQPSERRESQSTEEE